VNAPLMERAALASAAVVLVLAVVSLATGGPSKSGSNSAIASATPSPSVSAPSAIATPVPTVAPTKAPVAATKAPVKTAAPSGAVRPGPVKPPIPGKYLYDENDQGQTSSSSLEITDQGSGKMIENLDDGGQIDEVTWTAHAKYDDATTFGGGGGSIRCDWNPDFFQYVFPLHVGSSWTEKSSCHPNATVAFAVSGTSRVTGTKRVTVGAEQVDTWVVITDATITFGANGRSFTRKIHDEDDFAPDHGITVHEVEASSGTDPSTGQPSSDNVTRQLKNLTPGTQA
jgi:hypothetical protein